VAKQPSKIIVDRCLVRGSDNPPIGIRRGVEMHCQNCAVINSYMDQIHEIGFDSQAIGGWNSTGPWLIDNNYLSAAGENILIGGADVNIPNAVPSDIVITRNHFFKPYTWKVGHPTYAGIHWSVKNLLELKLGNRVLIEGNVFENIWVDAQSGEAFGFYSSNSNGKTPWALTSDITFRFNKVIRAEGGFGGPACDNGVHAVKQCGARFYFHDNLMTELGGASGRRLIVGGNSVNKTVDGPTDIFFNHNTMVTTNAQPSAMISVEAIVGGGRTPLPRFAFHNTILGYTSNYGIADNCKAELARVACWTESAWYKNIIYNTDSGTCGQVFGKHAVRCPVPKLLSVGFVDPGKGDYRLASSSMGKNAATDSKDAGADIDAVNKATAGVDR
jgi:hypothetical protein